jgi:hypothetical protein
VDAPRVREPHADHHRSDLRWEKLAVAVPIQVEVTEKVLANARKESRRPRPTTGGRRIAQANWAFENNVALPEAKGWLDKSLAISKAHSNQNLQARWLMKEGKKAEAIAAAKKAGRGRQGRDPAGRRDRDREADCGLERRQALTGPAR